MTVFITDCFDFKTIPSSSTNFWNNAYGNDGKKSVAKEWTIKY